MAAKPLLPKLRIIRMKKVDPQPNSKKHKLRSYLLFWSVALFIFAVDQASKLFITRHIPAYDFDPSDDIILIPGFLDFIHVHNSGAAWSLFSGHPWILAVLGVAMLGAIFYFRKSIELHKPMMQLTFGLMAGGIMGNLLDRFRFGYVIDFIDVKFPFYHWPTFNVGDCGISIGVFLYILMTFWPTKTKPQAA